MTEQTLDFVCVGPQRTASSWLHKRLSAHQQIRFPQYVKETMFFDQHYAKGMPWYWSHFPPPTPSQITGEVAPTYFDNDQARERLAQFNPLKIIINVRNPVARTYSLFRKCRNKGDVSPNYFEAVRELPHIEHSGRYAEHCPRWEQTFRADQCLYVVQEDLETDPQATIDRICTFLQIDRLLLDALAAQRYGASTAPPSRLLAAMGARTSRFLRARRLHSIVELAKAARLNRLFFGRPAGDESIPADVHEHLLALHEPDIDYLEHRLGRDFAQWRHCDDAREQ